MYDLCTWQVRRLERGGSCAAEGRTCHSSAFIAAVPHAAELIFVQVTGIALGNNGCMASAGEDGTVRIWEVLHTIPVAASFSKLSRLSCR